MKRLIETILSKIKRRDACFDIYPYYGIAPHSHSVDFTGCVVATVQKPKEEWPENFVEDDESPGCGTWYCPKNDCKAKCGGKQ